MLKHLQAAASRRADPDSERARPERAADRHAAKLGVLGYAGLPAAPSVSIESIDPASFTGKPRVVNGRDSRRTIRAAPAGPSVLDVLAASPA